MTEVVLALGSNMGDSVATLRAATSDLSRAAGILNVRASALFESLALTPTGYDPGAPRFVNGVVILDTTLGTGDLLALVRDIEDRHGRERIERWGPRTLDIDIITFGDLIIDEPDLTVPHREAHQRAFVLVPWLNLDSHAVLPQHGSVADLARGLDVSGLTPLPEGVRA